MKLTLLSRSGREVAEFDIADDATVDDLQAQIQRLSKEKKLKGIKTDLYPARQRLSIPAVEEKAKPVVLTVGKALSAFGLKTGDKLTLKDLGTQIGYQTVFFWEYFGPMVIFPMFLVFRKQIYGADFEPSETQLLATAYWMFHYFKRIVETYTVHSFSHATMPIFNLFRNSGYYWGFAAMVAYFICHPFYTSPPLERVYAGLAAALLMQVCNLTTHINLASLRAPGMKGYQIPRGFGFNFITCANYTFEIYGWFCFNIATQSVMGVVFMCCGAGQMVIWAGQKHARLRKLFDGKDGKEKYPRRFVILPPFI
ncbi:hypothetical protein CYMTET_41912 [Cymbomonas tetramitiformis]|uniref:3-oxo-5-alpha-steroid 4-dehydrogenase C-terminal domain-containing protein n=1 Tax=Cymbomonas tetramitiformis TaxID=36881 RepID=A0AAE0C6H1_9CHLO|nr:hypothetical protein CYMTET_41912 [Cymbomonas tetramitiformis]